MVLLCSVVFFFFFFKQKTAFEMRISDWSSDVCSSDLNSNVQSFRAEMAGKTVLETKASSDARSGSGETAATIVRGTAPADDADVEQRLTSVAEMAEAQAKVAALLAELHAVRDAAAFDAAAVERSEEHTTELQSLLPNSYAVYWFKNKK